MFDGMEARRYDVIFYDITKFAAPKTIEFTARQGNRFLRVTENSNKAKVRWTRLVWGLKDPCRAKTATLPPFGGQLLHRRTQPAIVILINRDEAKRPAGRFIFLWWIQKLHQPLDWAGRRF